MYPQGMQRPYNFLRLPIIYRIFIWMLNKVPFAIPVKRLREPDSLLAFFHPKPTYPFHVILLPKKAILSFSDLDPTDRLGLTASHAVSTAVDKAGFSNRFS